MKRISIVEDSADNRMLLNAILEGAYHLEEYVGGVEALAGLRATPADLVLLDISLPGMDGMEVLREIRADPALRDLRVIALTAHAMNGDRERFLSAGFDAYVAKPIVDEAVLVDAIEAHIHG
ncbi:MAG TPA: response regulator [Longimicrobium sp.]|nr:response regulator [Longimicrobium sp.]